MNSNQGKTLIQEVSEANFDPEVLQSKKPVLAAFLAPWSRPCHVLDGVLADVAAACKDQLKVVRVDSDDNPELSLWYEIQTVPALLYFVEGNVQARIIGTATKEAILAKVKMIFPEAGASLANLEASNKTKSKT